MFFSETLKTGFVAARPIYVSKQETSDSEMCHVDSPSSICQKARYAVKTCSKTSCTCHICFKKHNTCTSQVQILYPDKGLSLPALKAGAPPNDYRPNFTIC